METAAQKRVFGLPYNWGIGLLCVLGSVVLYEFYDNVLAGPSIPASSHSVATAPAVAPLPGALPGADNTPRRTNAMTNRGHSEEFNPPIHSKRPEDRLDLSKIDPTIRIDLLAKVQNVGPAGGTRNLFQVGAPPPLAAADPAKLPKGAEPIVRAFVGPVKPADPLPPPPPLSQPAIPITLKFYGYSTIRKNGMRTGYFMDGDDIMLAAEGELLKRRYRVVKISATSVLMEDTESKRTQTLPLSEETPG
jgi:hypothetical protein